MSPYLEVLGWQSQNVNDCLSLFGLFQVTMSKTWRILPHWRDDPGQSVCLLISVYLQEKANVHINNVESIHSYWNENFEWTIEESFSLPVTNIVEATFFLICQLRTTARQTFATKADFTWPTLVTRVTLTWYPVYAAHAVYQESNPIEQR